jgi:SPOR domain
MARFNGPTGQQGGQPRAGTRPESEADGRVWTPEQIARWQQQQQHAQAPHDPAAWRQPAQGVPTYPGQYAPAQGGHDPFAPPAPGWPPGPGAQPVTDHGSGAPPAWPAAPDSLQDRLSSNGYGRFEAPHDPHAGLANGYGAAQPHDSRNWDLNHYSPNHPQAAGYGGQAANGYPEPHGYNSGQPGTDYRSWDTGGGQGQGGYGGNGYDSAGYAPAGGNHHADYGHAHQHDYDQPEEDIGEPKRRPSLFVITAALIGAISIGGGLAYGYRHFSANPSSSPAVVKAEKAPAKARPSPSEKETAQGDKRFQNPLADANPPMAGSAVSTTPTDADGAPRRVPTFVIGRDGSVGAPPPAQVAPPPPSGSGVPGMVIEGGPRAPALRGPVPAELPPTIAAPQPEAPLRPAPRVADLPVPKARPAPAEPTSEPPPARAPAVVKRAPARDDAAAIPAAAAPPPAAGTAARAPSSGFVVVLASRKSRDEAFSQYPDLQTKYADLLANKLPDVRETDLTAQGKGIVYRLVVGPPGSKEAAIDTCNKLKAQGFAGCWATPY